MRDPLPEPAPQRGAAAAATGTPPLQALQVSRDHGQGRGAHEVSLTLSVGCFLALVGPSGAGKTTLLRLLAGLDTPDAGQVLRDGLAAPERRRCDTRVAMMFQRPRLVGCASALANVLTGRLGRLSGWHGLVGRYAEDDHLIAFDALAQMGLLERADTLSGGQQQRVSIARALAQQPYLLVADEPVASLDPVNAHNVLRILREASMRGLAVLASRHQPEMACQYAHRLLQLRDGRLQPGGERPAPAMRRRRGRLRRRPATRGCDPPGRRRPSRRERPEVAPSRTTPPRVHRAAQAREPVAQQRLRRLRADATGRRSVLAPSAAAQPPR